MKNKKIIKDIILFAVIMMYFAANIINRQVSNLDELWNYNFASNISNGLIPYKDFNMIITPLLSLIGGAFLTILGKELIVIRILNILLSSSIIFMIYKIMKYLEIKNFIIYLLLFVLSYIFQQYSMFDYNFAVSLISLIIVYLELKNYENQNKSYQILIGVLAGVCITLKQTTGIIIALTLVGYKILDIRNKVECKQYLKQLAYRIIGLVIPVLIMFFYLIINKAFYEFVDYCILGVSTFSNRLSYISRLLKNESILIKIFSIMPISLLIILLKYIKSRDKNALLIFTFGVSTLSVVYPISDETHLISGIFITTIGISYILNNIIKKDIKFLDYFCYIFIILLLLYETITGNYIYCNFNKNTEIIHYKGLLMEEKQINQIKNIGEYIKNSNKKIYILDATASYYMIPIDRYNKNYDMFCLGNFGSKGEKGQIEELQKESANIRLLIKNDKYSRNWQNPEQVRKWVIENMTKIGQIGIFDIYEMSH